MQHPHTHNDTRRRSLQMLAAGLSTGMVAVWPALAASPALTPIAVWKDPNCGCCKDWITLMEKAGFSATVHDTGNSAMRAKLGLPVRLGSCHTALVGGYLVEGHVPPADVRKLLQQKPKALGIAVPSMPLGSPGMDGPEYGGRKDPFDVLLVSKNGMNSDVSTTVFSAYRN